MRTYALTIALSLLVLGCGAHGSTPLVVEENSPIVGADHTTIEILGIETLGGLFTPLIPVGRAVPCSHTEVFSTASDGQTAIMVTLYRGTKNNTASNHPLGEFEIVGIPIAPRGMPQIEITFTITDRQISLSARDITSKKDLQIRRLPASRDTVQAADTSEDDNRDHVGDTGYTDPAYRFIAKDSSKLASIANGIQHATSLTLYEGLPHGIQIRQGGNIYEEAIATNKTVRIHGYHFYDQPLTPAAGEIEELRHLSSNDGSFHPHFKKFCGPYHPDYCLVWSDGKVTCHLLICFGCDEIKLYGPRSHLHVDVFPDAVEKFKGILSTYRSKHSDLE